MIRIAAILSVFAVTAVALAQTGPRSPRQCATCHLEWVSSFEDPNAILLIDKPGQPSVSTEATCLGCHDGGVGDSRRRVWLEHGHRTGTTPPDSMTIPESLPLIDGTLNCRTCHSAHAGPGETIATTIFTRVPNEQSQLCTMCHTSAVGDNHHPLKQIDYTIPDSTRPKWAHDGPNDNEVTCQSCHTPHGGKSDRLLVTSPSDEGLCLRCHEVLTPDAWKDNLAHTHPRNVKIKTDHQRETLARWETQTGPGETLICISCHAMHKDSSDKKLLQNTLADSAVCLDCHAGFDRIFDSRHDLRTSAESEQNARGMTATDSGPCSACHGAHEPARAFEASAYDITGSCTSCHKKGECAESAGGLAHGHPINIPGATPQMENMRLFAAQGHIDADSMACLTCHNPHETANDHFLRGKPDQVCASCHQAQSMTLAGAHEFSNRSDLVNAAGRTSKETGTCGTCHGIHEGKGPLMWTATDTPPTTPEDFCLGCHQQDGLAGEHLPQTLRHPLTKISTAAGTTHSTSLPFFTKTCERDPNGQMSCASCHDPHANSDVTPALLRNQTGGDTTSLCFECHPQTSPIHEGLHAQSFMENQKVVALAGTHPSTCGPCHATHADEVVNGMWVGPYFANANTETASRCLGCHGPGGISEPVNLLPHPQVFLREPNLEGATSILPLAHKGDDPNGQIDCLTCHEPHGRNLTDHANDDRPPSEAERRAQKLLLRSYVAPNLCSSCHGYEGSYRFLNYHELRAAPQ
ncbi:MAG TPA: cytochrome c3 family protein [Phycisphaerae bacterium]|nr:cytochrome c3 family protein [Phycisphaerae bacterium]